MIVYGEEDTKMGITSLKNLRNFPDREIISLAGAGHPAYIEKPDDWHKLMYNFLAAVEKGF